MAAMHRDAGRSPAGFACPAGRRPAGWWSRALALAASLGLAAASAVLSGAAPAFAETDGIPTPFGTANDPTRPVPKAPEAVGPGIVSAKLLSGGVAEVEELGEEGGGLAGFVVEVRVAGGSTTPLLLGSTIRAIGAEEGGTALLAACVLANDPALTVTRGDGLRLAAWNVTIGEESFLCGGGSMRMAMGVTGGGFRFVTAPGAEASAKLLLLFRAAHEKIGRLEFPGAALELPGAAEGVGAPAKANAAGAAAAPATPSGAEHPAATESAK